MIDHEDFIQRLQVESASLKREAEYFADQARRTFNGDADREYQSAAALRDATRRAIDAVIEAAMAARRPIDAT